MAFAINAQDGLAFQQACADGRLAKVKKLVEDEQTNNLYISLLMAAAHGNKGVVTYLLDYCIQFDSNINDPDVNGCTLSHWAACYGWRKVVEHVLISLQPALLGPPLLGIKLNTKVIEKVNATLFGGETPLMVSARWKRRLIFNDLLYYPVVEVDHMAEDGWTPLYWTAFHGWDREAILILDRGADLNARANQVSSMLNPPMQVLYHRDYTPEMQVYTPQMLDADNKLRGIIVNHLQRLRPTGAKVSKNVLHLASSRGWLDVVQFILVNTLVADVNAVTSDFSYTALGLAVRNRHMDVVNLLQQYGAEDNDSEDGY